jgi:hypothetical protein
MVKGMKVELIELENGFKVIYISSKPPRIEAKVIFDRDDISQKLIFTLMDVSHKHGFGCSPPKFGGIDDANMTFLIGTVLPSARARDKYLKRIHACLYEVAEFTQDFMRQLDFSRLDLSMFNNFSVEIEIYPEQLAALRDQLYNGSWRDFRDAMTREGRDDMADVALRCMKFEKNNSKDIGLVGHKLGFILNMLGEQQYGELEIN